MKIQHLQTIGLTSALLLTTIGGVVITPQVKANSLRESTQLVAVKTTSTNSFVSVGGHKTTGGVKIKSENGKRYLEFDRAFATDNGPDLKVVLHRNSSVGANLKEGDYVAIAPLNSFNGKQRYLIPNNIDLTKYSSVAIWCKQFNVTFGYAQLPDTPNVVSSGNFVTVEQDHPTAGKATIIEENGQKYLEFDADFTTARGPAVKVVLHRNNSVPVNLREEEYITIASLQSFDGKQRYTLPADIDLDKYQSVAIWCQRFNVTFGYADL
ncbi:MAG: DM13 domain-containing protein [Xenococcaceae cyanobacterium MO_234.B1]|nr:DM13 domain-containing protein [Xenococcaceae cyanobacterium MO_234.B1]